MDSKKQQNFMFDLIYFLVIGLALCILLGLHMGMNPDPDGNYFTTFFSGVKSLMAGPFHIYFTLDALKYSFMNLGLLAFAGLLYYIEYEKNKNIDRKAQGKAEWYTSTLNWMKKFNKKFSDMNDPTNNMILTQNVHLSMNSSVTRRNNNICVVGGSGSGKTRFMIKPNLLQANCSFVITDPSGEILQSEGEMLKKHGYKIKVFNLTDMAHSNSYNPFEYIRDDPGVLMMINCLIKNTNNGQKGGDPFWEKSETALLQALVFYLKDNPDIPKNCKNFTNIMKLLNAAEVNESDPNAKSPLDLLFDKVEAEDKNSLAVKQYKTFKMGAGKTLKSILISCGVRLTVFNLKEIANLTEQDDLELDKMGDEKTALFVIIPAADDTYNFLVSMMYSQLFETLYYRAENECPFEYLIKNGKDVLAIARKDPKGDKFTKRNAQKMLKNLQSARIRKFNKKCQIKIAGFEKTFDTEADALAFKEAAKKAKIEKGKLRLPYPVRFLLDEFSNIGQIPDFTKKLATMRKYEISCTIILQNLAQIKTLYKDDWESIIGNCDSFLFLGGQEQGTLEYISKLLGKKTVKSRNTGRSRSGKGGSSSQNDSMTATDLFSIAELQTMPKSDCVLIINGLHPFYDKKFDLVKHQNFDESGDSDKGKKFDCKKEIFNHAALSNSGREKKTASQNKKELESMLDSQAKNFGDLIKESESKTMKDAVNRIVLKKGEVVMNEQLDKKTGKVDFNYNIE